jgi:hypothetical protein
MACQWGRYAIFRSIDFSCFLSWGKAKLTLSQHGDKAMNMLLAFISKSKIDHNKALFLFDRMIVPILIYGSEIWGYEYAEPIEHIHTTFCKKIVKVPSNASHIAVLGEMGRLPIFFVYTVKCVKFWTTLLYMKPTGYPRVSYTLLYELYQGAEQLGPKKSSTYCIYTVLVLCGCVRMLVSPWLLSISLNSVYVTITCNSGVMTRMPVQSWSTQYIQDYARSGKIYVVYTL